MYFTKATALAVLAFTASAFARPALKNPVTIQVSGVKEWAAFDTAYPTNETYHLAYQQNDMLGGYVLQPIADRAAALEFNIMPNGTLESTTGLALGIVPLVNAGYGLPVQGEVTFANYTGLEGTTVSKHHGEVINSDADFGAWAVCDSQYGIYFDYVSPLWNQTAEDESDWFHCYSVKLHARH